MKHFVFRSEREILGQYRFTCNEFRELLFTIDMPKNIYEEICQITGITYDTYESDSTIRLYKNGKYNNYIVEFDKDNYTGADLYITVLGGYVTSKIEITDANLDDFNQGFI